MGSRTNYGTIKIKKENGTGTYKIKIVFSEAFPSINFNLWSIDTTKIVLDTFCRGVLRNPVYFYLSVQSKESKKWSSWVMESRQLTSDIWETLKPIHLAFTSNFPLVSFEKKLFFLFLMKD